MNIAPTIAVNSKGLRTTIDLSSVDAVLTTVEAKKACYIDFSEDDTDVDALVLSATLWVQEKLNRALVTQEVIVEWDSVGYEVVLPYAPIQSITSVVTVNEEGTETPLVLNTGYFYRNGKLKVSTSLGLKVTYQAGYGDPSDVPQPIRTAIARSVKNMYDRRDDDVLENNIDQVEFNSMALLTPYMNYDV